MFRYYPRSFTNKEAAIKAAEAFEMEEEMKWVVVTSVHDSNTFKPCRKNDLKEAEEEEWVVIEKELSSKKLINEKYDDKHKEDE